MGNKFIAKTNWEYFSPHFQFVNDLPVESSAWSGHYFFAYDLVSNLKPRVIVELGTHKGNSLFSFAQAIKDNKLKTKLHGVDTWEGDKHAGHYGEDIYKAFLDISKKFYKNVDIVSHKMLFDKALVEFKDNSIDILHIDGLHTYEAVKHDFETWLPKVRKDSGIILFHDVCEKSEDFGVYKLWEELGKEYKTVTFDHYHGLGVLFLNPKIFNDIATQVPAWTKLYKELSEKQFLEKNLEDKQKEISTIKTSYLNSLKNVKDLRDSNKRTKEKLVYTELELKEYNGFKDGKIWRVLEAWRRLKNTVRHSVLIKILNILRRIASYLIHSPKLLLDLGPQEFIFRTYIALRYVKYSEYNRDYQILIRKSRPTKEEILRIKEEIEEFQQKPLISIVMPVYNVDPKWLQVAIDSIKNQWYTNWELCIADDCSTNPQIKPLLAKYAKQDSRIKIVFREKNGHISECTNSALKLVEGEYVALMDNDDEIYPQALYKVAKAINENPAVGLIYSNEDKIEMNGDRTDPIFKPSYSPDYLLSTNYFCHLTVVRKDIIDKIDGFRKGFEGSQDYDLFLRAVEHTKKVVHINDILYGWRKIPGSTALKYDEKGYAEEASFKALSETILRRRLDATVIKGLQGGFFRVKYNIKEAPPITIIIFGDKEKAKNLSGHIAETTEYPKLDFCISNNIEKTLKKLKNNYFIIVQENIRISNPYWIHTLLEHAQREEISAVGGKVLSASGEIICTGFEKREDILDIRNSHIESPPHIQSRANLTMNYDFLPIIFVMSTKEKFGSVKVIKSDSFEYPLITLRTKNENNKGRLLYTPYSEITYLNNDYRESIIKNIV